MTLRDVPKWMRPVFYQVHEKELRVPALPLQWIGSCPYEEAAKRYFILTFEIGTELAVTWWFSNS